jgi:hypothetical protein
MVARGYLAGQDVDAWCGKCKKVFRHVIHAVVDGTPVRVECKTCGAVHRYKASQRASGRTTATARRKKAPAGPPVDNSLIEYQEAILGRTEADGRRYAINETFADDEVVIHSKFGLGVVVQVLPDRKVEVRFRQGVRTLVHERG